jgi:hypothetical protein
MIDISILTGTVIVIEILLVISYVRMYVLGDEYTDLYHMTLPPVTCVLSSKYAVRYHIFSEDPIES